MKRMVHDGTRCSYKDAFSLCVRGDCRVSAGPRGRGAQGHSFLGLSLRLSVKSVRNSTWSRAGSQHMLPRLRLCPGLAARSVPQSHQRLGDPPEIS